MADALSLCACADHAARDVVWDMNADDPLTNEDLEMLRYFWEEKGDMERYVGYEIKLEALKVQFPEIIKANEDYKASRRVLGAE